jgi:hypothetical protein
VANAEADAAAVMTATEGTANAEAVDAAKAEAAKAEAAKAAKAEGCIGGGSMHWRRRNALEEHGSGWS